MAKAKATKPATKTAKTAAVKRPADKRTYDKPDLRERLKAELMAGDKGGRPGQWSARKAQLLAHAYEAAGGGYLGPKTATQAHLSEWAAEDWQTSDRKPAHRGNTTARYLRKKAWDRLTPAQRKATDDKKAGDKAGRQFVANTAPARRARRATTEH